jgi:hypothetical protein
MNIDPSRRGDQAAGVDLMRASTRSAFRADDFIGIDSDIAGARRCAGAVHDSCAANYQVMHWSRSPSSGARKSLVA